MRHLERLTALGAALILGYAPPGFAQFDRRTQFAPGDIRDQTRQLSRQVNQLTQEIDEELGEAPNGRHLVHDSRELAQAVDEFRDSLDDRTDPNRARQAFAAIDGSWNHLQGELSRVGQPTRGVARSLQGVEQVEAQLRTTLGLNPPPQNFYGAAAAPTGVDDTRRIAHALVSRAQALAAIIPTQMAGSPDVNALAQDANNLALAADRFHDNLDAGQGIEALRAAYGPVLTLSDRLGPTLSQGPPALQRAWQGYAYADATLRQALGLAAPANAPPNVLPNPAPGVVAGPSPIAPLAEKLVEQLDDFLRNYAPTARVVPEGMQGLDDANRLRAAAVAFQQQAARGLAPNELAFAYRDVDAYWQRLGRRVQRIAQGRTGPNIQRVGDIGQTCEQIHQMLAMPGSSMTFPPPNPDGGF